VLNAHNNAIEASNAKVLEEIEQSMVAMEQWTANATRQLRMTDGLREVADWAWQKASRRRRGLVVAIHTPVEQRFLRMMVRLAVAAHPDGRRLARRIARYLSANYAFEWIRSPITIQPRAEARNIILHNADSTFGATPEAASFAFVLCHHEQRHIENVSRYSELYTATLALQRDHYFRDLHAALREALGLPAVMEQLDELIH